jgi:hypothetical protein
MVVLHKAVLYNHAANITVFDTAVQETVCSAVTIGVLDKVATWKSLFAQVAVNTGVAL